MEYEHWEYRALVWDTYYPRDGPDYEPARTQLIADGWREFVRAPRQAGIMGGACIMRRPKDEPRMWTEKGIREVARNGLLCMDALMKEAIQEIVRTTPVVIYATKEETNG